MIRTRSVIAVAVAVCLGAGACTGGDTDSTPTPGGPTRSASGAEPLKDARRPQIWFGPLDPWSWDRFEPGSGPRQFYDLFVADATWQRASDAVHVVRLYPVWLESFGTREQIQSVVEDLERREIAISYEAGPLPETAQCNAGTVEGFWGPPAARRIAQNIHGAGVVLRSMDLEHPFDAATYGPAQCRMSPTDIARGVTATIDTVRAVFPNVIVGSIETADMDVKAVAAWLQAYREVTGRELAYFHLDPNYLRLDWATRAKEIEDYVRSRGVDFGIIYFGDEQDSGDQEWLARAERRFVEYEVLAGGRPDHVIFQSWHPHPERLFPENDPGTFTYLINRYLRRRAALTVTMDNGVVKGTLTTAGGVPVAGARVEIQAEPVSGPGLVTAYTLSGVVPGGAVKADVGYRINTECDCSGSAAFDLHAVTYTEVGRSGNQVPNGDFSRQSQGWGAWGSAGHSLVKSDSGPGRMWRVSASPGEDAGLNSGLMSVTGGATFNLSFTARVDPRSVGSGYFQIIFQDGTKELRRLKIPLAAARVDAGAAVTSADGRFELALAPGLRANTRIRAWFTGDGNAWPALGVIASG